MSFLAKSQRLPQTAPSESPHISSYREADPVPLGYGDDIFPSHWLSEPFNWRTAYGGQGKPEWQMCSIAAHYRAGPIKYIGGVYMNGKKITALNYTFDDSEDYHDFTINASLAGGYAWTLRLYRGTESQAVDATLVAGTGQDHPAYRGGVWALWQNIDLGQGVTSLPSLSLELLAYTPAIDSYPAGADTRYGVNVFAAIYALLLDNKGGLDLDEDILDPAHWGSQAAALESTGIGTRTGDLVKFHPTVSQVKDAAQVLAEWLAYVDGYLYIADGKLCVGWFPNVPPSGTLPEITEHDLEEKPSGGSFPDWNQSPTSVVVIYRDKERDLADAPALYQVPANRETGILSQPARADRPALHDADQAAAVAVEQAAGPLADTGINLAVLKSRAVDGSGAPLLPGDLVNWDYGPHALDLPCRVIARRIRSGAASDLLTLVRERGAFPTPYVAPTDPRVLPTPSDPGEIDSSKVRLWFLPEALALTLDAAEPRQVTALIDRAHRGIIGALFALSPTGSAPWEQILDSRFFVAKCLAANAGGAPVGSGDTTVRVSSLSVNFARFEAQSAVNQVDDALLALVGDELVSVGSIASVSSGIWDLGILRGRQGTTAAAHADATPIWLFLRSELQAAPHNEFYRVRDGSNVYSSSIATKHFQIALFTVDEIGVYKPAAPGLSLQLPDLSPDDSAGYTVVLTKEAHAVACDETGTPLSGQLGAGSLAKTDVKVFRGTIALTAVNSGPNSDQFSASIASVTNATGTKEDPDTFRADTVTADTGSIFIDVLVAGAFTVRKLFSLSKVAAGAAVQIQYSIDGSTGWHDTFTTGDRYMRQRIGSGDWSSAIRIVGDDGVRGSRSFYASTSLTTPLTDLQFASEADAAIAAYGMTKTALDTVTIYKTSENYSVTKFWNPLTSTWDTVAQVIDGNLIVHGTIGSDQIVVGISLTAPLIMGGLLKLNGDCTICSDAEDDTGIVRMNGGGGPNTTIPGDRGGQIDVLGNAYPTGGVAGSILLTPGGAADGSIRMRDRTGTDRIVINPDGSVSIYGLGTTAGDIGVFLAASFGASPDAADNHDSIQAAIDQAEAAGGGTVVLPSGTLKTSMVEADSPGVKIVSYGKTTLTPTDDDATAVGSLLRLTASDCRVKGVKFDGKRTSQTLAGDFGLLEIIGGAAGITAPAAEDCEFVNATNKGLQILGKVNFPEVSCCRFGNLFNSIYTNSTSDGVPQGIQLFGNKQVAPNYSRANESGGVKIQSHDGALIGRNHLVTRNQFIDCGQMGVELWGYGGVDSVVSHNVVEKVDFGISLDRADRAVCNSNDLKEIGAIGIELATTVEAEVNGNNVWMYAWDSEAEEWVRGTTNNGIEASNGVHQRNVISANNIAGASRGIHIFGGSTFGAGDHYKLLGNAIRDCNVLINHQGGSHLSIKANTLQGPCAYHLFFDFTDGDAEDIEVVHNKFQASATDDNIIVYDGDNNRTITNLLIRWNNFEDASHGNQRLNLVVPRSRLPNFIGIDNSFGSFGSTFEEIPYGVHDPMTFGIFGGAMRGKGRILVSSDNVNNRWYRIFRKDFGAPINLLLSVFEQNDGRQTASLFRVGAAPYDFDSGIVREIEGDYLGGNIAELIYNNPGGGEASFHEIWIKVKPFSGTGTIEFHLSDHADGLVNEPTGTTTEPTWGSNHYKAEKRGLFSGMYVPYLDSRKGFISADSNPWPAKGRLHIKGPNTIGTTDDRIAYFESLAGDKLFEAFDGAKKVSLTDATHFVAHELGAGTTGFSIEYGSVAVTSDAVNNRWYRILNAAMGAAVNFKLRILEQMDGRQSRSEFMIFAAPYGQDSGISRMGEANYGGGNIVEVIYNNPSADNQEVWIRVRPFSGTGTVHFWFENHPGGVVSNPSPSTTEPSWADNHSRCGKDFWYGGLNLVAVVAKAGIISAAYGTISWPPRARLVIRGTQGSLGADAERVALFQSNSGADLLDLRDDGHLGLAGDLDISGAYYVDGTKVVGNRQSDPGDGATDAGSSSPGATGGMVTTNTFTGTDTVNRGDIATEVNTHGAKLNSFATKINDIGTVVSDNASKYNDLASRFNALLDKLQAHGLIE